MPRVVAGGEFGSCTAAMSCRDATNTCVSDGSGPEFCSPTCTHACEQFLPYLPNDVHPGMACVAYDNTPNRTVTA